MVPVQGPPGFNSHPVNGKIHLPYKRGHADSHSVSCTENYTWLLTHDPTGGSTITDNMTAIYWCRFVLWFSVRFAIACHPKDWKFESLCEISCRTVWKHSLIEVRFGDLEEGTITLSFDGEDERLSCEYSQLSNHLTRLGHKQTHCFLLVNHLLIDMKTTRQDKMQTHIL